MSFIINIFYVVIMITLSRTVRMLLNFILENKTLVQTIKHILEVFPEGIIIQAPEESSNLYEIKYTNEVAKKTLISSCLPRNLQGGKIDKMFRMCDIETDHQSHIEDILETNSITLEQTLLIQREKCFESRQDVHSQVELVQDRIESPNNTCFGLKTVEISWDSSDRAFLHIFVDTTVTKRLEKERATNK